MHFVLVSNNPIINDPLDLPDLSIVDNRWHNITVKADGTRFTLEFDGKASRSKDFGITFDFDSLDIQEIAISGDKTLLDNTVMPGKKPLLLFFLYAVCVLV